MDNPRRKPTLHENARREAITVLVVLALAMTWTLSYCYLHGYQHTADSWVVRQGLAAVRTPDDFHAIVGIPDWVVVGILFPWLLCTAFTVGFCLGMKDDDLGREAEEPDHAS